VRLFVIRNTADTSVAFSFLVFLRGGSRKGEGKSNVLGIPLFLLLFLVLRLLLKVPKGTPNLRIIEGKGKASQTFAFSCRLADTGKVDNQRKTAVNFYFLSLQGVQARSQQCKQKTKKQTQLLACHFT